MERSLKRWWWAPPGLMAPRTTPSLFQQPWQAERTTSEWGCPLLSSRMLEQGRIYRHCQFKILGILKSFFVVILICMWSCLIFLNSWNMFSSWLYNLAKYWFLWAGKKKKWFGFPKWGFFIMRALRVMMHCIPEHIAHLLARPSDALHEAFQTDLCVSVLGAGFWHWYLALPNPSLSLCLMPEISNAFRFWRSAKLHSWIRRPWKDSRIYKLNISCHFKWMNHLCCWKESRMFGVPFFSL